MGPAPAVPVSLVGSMPVESPSSLALAVWVTPDVVSAVASAEPEPDVGSLATEVGAPLPPLVGPVAEVTLASSPQAAVRSSNAETRIGRIENQTRGPHDGCTLRRKRIPTPRVWLVMLDRPSPSPLLLLLLASACASLGGALELTEDPGDEGDWKSEAGPVIPLTEPEPEPMPEQPSSGPPALVAGGFHACLLDDGRVACWGLGDFGQLGDGFDHDREHAVEVAGLHDAVQLGAGLEHSCARLASGELRCWGANPFGQLGDGTDVGSNTPRSVVEIDDAIDLQLGDFEACAVRQGGAVACWGGNLGGMPIAMQPDTAWRSRPKVEYRRPEGADRLAVSQSYRCLWGEAGVDCWGDPAFDDCRGEGRHDGARCPLGELATVTDLDLDPGFGCAVLRGGTVKCWGTHSYGQTPTGGHACYLGHPEPGCPRALQGMDEAIRVSVGTWHACALRSDGRVMCWGTNNFGQIGTPLAETEELRWRDVVAPMIVEPWRGVVEIAAGRGFTCARMRDGGIDCIGDMAEGRRPRPIVAHHPI